jgi:hypothetical protein
MSRVQSNLPVLSNRVLYDDMVRMNGLTLNYDRVEARISDPDLLRIIKGNNKYLIDYRHTYFSNVIKAAQKDLKMFRERMLEYDKSPSDKPRVGDFIWMGKKQGWMRFAYDWAPHGGIQICYDGSFYLGNGYCSMSGSLEPSIDHSRIVPTDQTKLGRCWAPHNGYLEGGSGIYMKMPFRVFRLKGTHKLG